MVLAAQKRETKHGGRLAASRDLPGWLVWAWRARSIAALRVHVDFWLTMVYNMQLQALHWPPTCSSILWRMLYLYLAYISTSNEGQNAKAACVAMHMALGAILKVQSGQASFCVLCIVLLLCADVG